MLSEIADQTSRRTWDLVDLLKCEPSGSTLKTTDEVLDHGADGTPWVYDRAVRCAGQTIPAALVL